MLIFWISLSNFELNAELFISENNTATIAFRSGIEEYRAMFSSNGSSRLYRGDELLDAYVMQPAEAAWFAVQIIAADDTISISVDGITGILFTDSLTLEAGSISFHTGDANSGSVMLDNLSIIELDAASVIFSEEAPAIDAMPEAEATQEAETTPEAEVTQEAEMTPEAEVTEEAPIANVQMSEQLSEVIELINNGELFLAEVILQSASYEIDETKGVGLKIYPAGGIHLAEVDQLLQSLNASDVTVQERYITAYLSIENLAILAESPLIGQITKPTSARSTGPIGSVYSEGFDALGVLDWHNAGFTGTNIKVGIVDTEFDGNGLDSELSCLAVKNDTGDPQGHGLTMAEIICDIAPNATVYTYPLDLNIDAYISLANNVYQAVTDQMDVLLISAEITDAVPGDGTGLEDGADDPYIALETARNQGMVIFAGAGNFGATYSGGVTALERSVTLSVAAPAGVIDPEAPNTYEDVAVINISATAGDDIIVMWNDWTGLGTSDFANIEDFYIDIDLDPALNGGDDEGIIDSSARTSIADSPSVTLNLDPSTGNSTLPMQKLVRLMIVPMTERTTGDVTSPSRFSVPKGTRLSLCKSLLLLNFKMLHRLNGPMYPSNG